ncbi:MAG: ROK family protein [Candidatus Ratteibacteria bacterium]|jgi:glucokinase
MRRAIGLDLGGTYIKAGLVAEDGTLLKKGQFPSCAETGSQKEVLSQMKQVIESFWEEGLTGIGIGTPGVVRNDGTVFDSPNLPDWDNLPLKQIFEEIFPVPVIVENDASSITWGEYLFGAGQGCKSIICLTLGTGVGGGIVQEGKLLRGGTYSAVELGHITVDFQGPQCKCGSIGCIESFVGRDYLVARATDQMRQGKKTILTTLSGGDYTTITPKLLAEAAHQGDPFAISLWHDTGVALGAHLTGMVNLINPDKIILGGGIAQAGEILFEPVRHTIQSRAMKRLGQYVEVVPCQLGSNAGIVSGGALAFGM